MTEKIRPNRQYTRSEITELTGLGSELDGRFLKIELHQWVASLTPRQRKALHDPTKPVPTSPAVSISGAIWRMLNEPTKDLKYRMPDIEPDIMCLQKGHPRDQCTCTNLRKSLEPGNWVELARENKSGFAVGMDYATSVANRYPDDRLRELRGDGVSIFKTFVKNFRPPAFEEPLPF